MANLHYLPDLAAATGLRLPPALRWRVPATAGPLFTLLSRVTVWLEAMTRFGLAQHVDLRSASR